MPKRKQSGAEEPRGLVSSSFCTTHMAPVLHSDLEYKSYSFAIPHFSGHLHCTR